MDIAFYDVATMFNCHTKLIISCNSTVNVQRLRAVCNLFRGIVEWLIKQSTIDGSQAARYCLILDSQHSQESAC